MGVWGVNMAFMGQEQGKNYAAAMFWTVHILIVVRQGSHIFRKLKPDLVLLPSRIQKLRDKRITYPLSRSVETRISGIQT